MPKLQFKFFQLMSSVSLMSKSFVFNPFQENTYVLFNQLNQAIIIDPGMSNPLEENELVNFLEEKGLTPLRVILTHAHVDHVLGLNFLHRKYGLPVLLHPDSIPVLEMVPQYAKAYGFDIRFDSFTYETVDEGGTLDFDLKALHIPGHVPGHLVFYSDQNSEVWVGDVLFYQSIGRTDLPGGNYNQLISGIKEKLFLLTDQTKVYSGHGPTTTIGHERNHNPFLN